MSKPIKIILITLASLVVVAAIVLVYLNWTISPKIPKPISDVPIEYKIGWWAYQNNLKVDSLTTSIVFDGLNLFNGTAVIQYNLSGTINYKNGWRPFIKSVHISERWDVPPENFKGNNADIVVTPIVAVDKDDSYTGELIDFNIQFQDYIKSGGWGKNEYIVTSQSNESSFILHQKK